MSSRRSKTSNRKIKKKVIPDSIYTDLESDKLIIDLEGGEESSTTKESEPGPSQKAQQMVDTPPATPAPTTTTPAKVKDPKRKRPKANKDDSSSSEEEKWLEKIKDPKLMTARQRAMYDRENTNEKDFVPPPETLMSLPTGYKEKVRPVTAEMIERAQMKSAKRKQLADEKREKDKKKTMERLLKKQESKLSKVSKSKLQKPGVPIITYKSTNELSVMIFPVDYDPGLSKPPIAELPKIIPCVVCKSPKKYNCSKTNAPLCSFRCYKENVGA